MKKNSTVKISFWMCSVTLFLSMLIIGPENAFAADAVLSLVPSVSSISSGGSFYVDINMDTGGNDVVVARAIIRYDKTKIAFDSWTTTNSVFVTNNNACYQADGGTDKPANSPCQIITNNTANGIVSIAMATPHQNVINGTGQLVARANFHALTDISSNLINTMGLHYASSGNDNDSSVVVDDNSGTDVLGAPAERSTVQYGDLNSDRTVNGGDFSILHANYGNTTPGNVADINADNTVNGADFSVLHAYYNQAY